VAGGGGPEGRGIGRPPAAPARIGMRPGPRQERKGRAGVAAGALARLHLLPATGGGGVGGGGSSGGYYYYYYWCARVWPDASDVTGNKGESAGIGRRNRRGEPDCVAWDREPGQASQPAMPVPATESVTRRAALAFTHASPGPVRPTRAFSGARHSPALHARRATTGPRASVA